MIMPESEPPADEIIEEDCKPHVGMEFDSLDASKDFWNKYAHKNGFGDRIRSTQKDKDGVVIRRVYVCSRQGKKAEDKRTMNSKKRVNTRCDCGVFMKIAFHKETGKYVIQSLMEEHNHSLEGKLTSHYIRAHRNINDMQARAIDVAVGAGLGPKTTHRLMSLEAGGIANVGYTTEEIKSYLRTRRSKNMELGEAHSILWYIQEKSNLFLNFFHKIQVDCEEKITNIYWADSKMIVDYETFGDVVMFDTTFGTNKESRPLGIFSGFNNHKETVIFGSSLLYDETIESFEWLFNVFLECHSEKKPGIIFTDQDAAMKNALHKTMPEVRHCLCSWHLIQNATKNLAGTLNRKEPHLQMKFFVSDLCKCMYKNCDVEEFEKMWENMIGKYGLVENTWLQALYEKRSQWSVAYRMNIFSAGVRSTQLSESTNARLKKELGGRLSMGKFFERFDTFLADVREREKKSDVDSRQSTPHLIVQYSPILKHAAQVYTPNIFQLFSKQFEKMLKIWLNENNQIQRPHVRIAHDDDREFTINFDPSLNIISCSCCTFEMYGYLCSHILRVFDICRVEAIPEKYIMKRWTKYARSGLEVVECPRAILTDVQAAQRLCSKFMRMCYRSIRNPFYVQRIDNFINGEQELYDTDDMLGANGNDAGNIQCSAKNPITVGVSGLKKKINPKGNRKKRIKSCIERSKGSQCSQTQKAGIFDFFPEASNEFTHEVDDVNICLTL